MERVSERRGHTELTAWLVSTRGWTPLHHLEELSPARARTLLRDGADPHAQPSPTPAQRASAVGGEVSELVLRAARPWSRVSHELYPDAARARAVELLRLGQQLAIQPRFAFQEQAVVDVWVTHVMPHVVSRA